MSARLRKFFDYGFSWFNPIVVGPKTLDAVYEKLSPEHAKALGQVRAVNAMPSSVLAVAGPIPYAALPIGIICGTLTAYNAIDANSKTPGFWKAYFKALAEVRAEQAVSAAPAASAAPVSARVEDFFKRMGKELAPPTLDVAVHAKALESFAEPERERLRSMQIGRWGCNAVGGAWGVSGIFYTPALLFGGALLAASELQSTPHERALFAKFRDKVAEIKSAAPPAPPKP
jgi:hypothetical protein